METGLLHDYFVNFFILGEKYCFCIEGSMQWGFNPREVRLKQTLETNIGGYPIPARWGADLGWPAGWHPGGGTRWG